MNKKRDVLLLLQFFYPEYISSASLPFDTATVLAKEGYSVDVLCGYPHEYTEKTKVPRKETVNDIHIKRVKYLQPNRKSVPGRIVNYFSLTTSMFFRLFAMRKYKTIIVYSNPPILPLIAAWAVKLFKCKLIFVAYDLYPDIALKTNRLSEGSLITKFMNYINDIVYKRADAVVALSSEMKAYIVKNRQIISEKVCVIPNWYRDEYKPFAEDDRNAFAEVAKNRFTIGYFGNMGIAQDMEPIKAAIKYYKNDPDICFLLSGHGSKHAEIERMIIEEKIENAYLYGFLQNQEYSDALHASNCAVITLEKGLTGLCVPSKTYGYMMQGLPIVAIMDDSDTVNDIRKGAGYHVADNSSEMLIDIIRKIKDSPQDCRARGEISRQLYLENYTPEICLKKYVALLKDILATN